MRIEIRGRNVKLNDELEALVRKRFQRLGRQVSGLATLEVVLSEERNPSDRRQPGGRGNLLSQGHDPARAGGLRPRWPTRCTNWPRTCGAR